MDSQPDSLDIAEPDDATYAVRPYAMVGGRTRTGSTAVLPVESLIQGLGPADEIGLTAERRRILELTATQYLSVAELSAHVHLPVGVIRILVTDLSNEGRIQIHEPSSAHSNPATSLSVLESVLNGISAL
ncbi:MAG: DUF742 domain-containing protein [Angustibacter sp.]